MKFRITRVLTTNLLIRINLLETPEWVYLVEAKASGIMSWFDNWSEFGVYGTEKLAKDVIYFHFNSLLITRPAQCYHTKLV